MKEVKTERSWFTTLWYLDEDFSAAAKHLKTNHASKLVRAVFKCLCVTGEVCKRNTDILCVTYGSS
ncbi:MAG: hypothetical protein K6F44_05585, partial [Lachnospiraceae bacterium]|nr:hypothetical protein [Lachnospiraceae bacterium]